MLAFRDMATSAAGTSSSAGCDERESSEVEKESESQQRTPSPAKRKKYACFSCTPDQSFSMGETVKEGSHVRLLYQV